MKKSDLDKRNMLMFCHRHGITANKEAIWKAIKDHDTAVANVRKRFGLLRQQSPNSNQLSMAFGPTSSWPYKGS